MREFFYNHHLAIRRLAFLVGVVVVAKSIWDANLFDAAYRVAFNGTTKPTEAGTVFRTLQAAVGGWLIGWALWARSRNI